MNIDWNAVWCTAMQRATFVGNGAEFWTNWQQSLSEKPANTSGYVKQMLKRIRVSPQASVLDVGAGTGALALPLAATANYVTALDQSLTMLQAIASKTAENEIDNIRLVQADWTKARLGIDFAQHDVVLVSRSLPGEDDLRRSLRLINDTARHYCYITVKADGYDALEAKLCEYLQIDYYALPEYSILHKLLHSMGIYANIEFFNASSKRYYNNLREARCDIVRSYPLAAADYTRVEEFIAGQLVNDQNGYRKDINTTWALLWWEKSTGDNLKL
ncbi:MAG: class I SAM-dependent methyltransferase [Bacillota bacterium]